MNTLRDNIKSRMGKLGITQQRLADLVNVKQPSINDILSGKTKRTSYLPEIAAALHTSPEWLLTGTGPEEAPPPHLPADLEAFITATAALVAADGGESAKQRALSEITEWLDARHSENQPADPQGLLTQLRVIKARIAKEADAKEKRNKITQDALDN